MFVLGQIEFEHPVCWCTSKVSKCIPGSIQQQVLIQCVRYLPLTRASTSAKNLLKALMAKFTIFVNNYFRLLRCKMANGTFVRFSHSFSTANIATKYFLLLHQFDRYCLRFFVQVGHQTTYAYSGNEHFF